MLYYVLFYHSEPMAVVQKIPSPQTKGLGNFSNYTFFPTQEVEQNLNMPQIG